MNEVIIIGCGPAGLSAAIQLKRNDINFMVLEKHKIGGLAGNADLIENYPGFPNGIKGRDLVDLFKKQLKKNKISPVFEEVVCLDHINHKFYVKTNINEYFSNFLIIASGTCPLLLPLQNIDESALPWVHYDLHSIENVRHKHIAVIGAGDAAFDYALGLSRHNKVTIFNRSKYARCLPVLYRRAAKKHSITYLNNASVLSINKSGKKNISLEYYHRDRASTVNFDHLLPAIGRKPANNYFTEKFSKKINDLLSSKLLYIAGDINNARKRQIGIAVGNGILSAMEIKEQIEVLK